MNVGLSDDICADLNNHESEENSVQDTVSSLLMYRSILEASVKVSRYIGITGRAGAPGIYFLIHHHYVTFGRVLSNIVVVVIGVGGQ